LLARPWSGCRGLQLQVVVAGAEDVPKLPGGLLGARRVPAHRLLRDLALEAAGEGDDPRGVLAQVGLVDARLVVEPLEVGGRGQLHQGAVAGLVAGEQRQVIGRVPGAAAFLAHVPRGDVELAAEDRLDAGLHRVGVEVDDPVHLPVVGDRDGGHVERGGLLRQLRNEDHPVQQAVLGVHVQVHEVGVFLRHLPVLRPSIER
jgi:hypothetical protein